MKKLDFLLKSNKEIFASALKNRIPNCDKTDIIKELTTSVKPDVTDYSHRDLLFRFLCNRHANYESMALILEKIGPLNNISENGTFLRCVKSLNKASVKKIDLLVDYYIKNKSKDSQELIFNYLVISYQIVGFSPKVNKENLLQHLYNRFVEFSKSNEVSIYHKIRFYEMIASKTKSSKILNDIFKDIVQDKSQEAFRLRNDLFKRMLKNDAATSETINGCFRVLNKTNLINALEKIDRNKFFYKLDQKGFHILYRRVGFQSFRRLLNFLKREDVIASCRYDLPKSIAKEYERVLLVELKRKRNGFNITRLKD